MKVAVDAYYLAGRLRGMARFAQMLLQSLPEDTRCALPASREGRAIKFITSDQKWFPFWEQCVLPFKARAAKADFLLCPYNTGPLWGQSPPVIVTIHDLIFLDEQLGASPSAVQNLGRLYRKFVAGRIARKSHRVVTCSEYSKSRIVDLFGIPAEKIVVIPNIIGQEWLEASPEPDLVSPYILAVAGEAPSKNTRRLIEAMAIVHAHLPQLTLKIAGVNSRFHPAFQAIAKEHGVAAHVQLLPYLDDAELRTTYQRASAFVCPSLAEGFGIPLLEAMASGIPAASSNATSLPEVAGDCAVYFDPLDPSAMASAIMTSLDGSETTQKRVANARARAAQFTLPVVQSRITEFWRSLAPSREPATPTAEHVEPRQEMASAEQPEISLVLCTYGSEKPLHVLFESLRWQNCRFQLLIVDQNADDRVPRMLEGYPDLPYTLLHSAPGLSRARNVGLRHAEANVIAFPDDDCAYPKRTLREILDFFKASPETGILSGRNNMQPDVLQTTCLPLRATPVSSSLFLRDTASFSIFIDRRKLPQRTKWDVFDEKLGVGAPFGAAEETDYLYRLLREGMHPYAADTEFTFHPDKELQFSNFKRATNYGLGAGAFFRKNLTPHPSFLKMALRAFVGPGLRALRSALLQDKVATEYHTRTLLARYQGFLTWPRSG